MSKINVFHIGPQKSGTTWLYEALREHNDVCVPEKDSIHYMNMFYHMNHSFMEDKFSEKDKKVLFEPTPSYIRDLNTPERIYKYNPNAKIMLTARNPVERAFSHYWHEKKKDRFNFTFEEVFENYDLFSTWVEPGKYALHYKRFLEYFPKEQVKILFFDDLKSNPRAFLDEVCEFCEIRSDFTPSILNKKINRAEVYKSTRQRKIEGLFSTNYFARKLINAKNRFITKGHIETLADVESKLKNELIKAFYEDICELENITKRDLSHWKNEYL